MSLGDRIKAFVSDFPHQGGTTVVALTLILGMGVVVIIRFALGKIFPDGYDAWLVFLATLAGVATGGMIGKRATDRELARIKAGGPPAATVNAETANVSGGPVNVDAKSSDLSSP